ncbi:MAG: hypothetical protein GX154_05035, partial [Clostridiales bacterium]|nr:hypothetical protein [Clostridiales bacterium]
NKEMARISKDLATIDKDVPIDIEISKYVYDGPDYEKLINLYQKLGFRSLLERTKRLYDLPVKENEREVEISFKLIENEEELKEIYKIIKKEKIFAFKTSSDFIYFSVNNKQFAIPVGKDFMPMIKTIMEDVQIE